MKRLGLFILLCICLIGLNSCDNSSSLKNKTDKFISKDKNIPRILNGKEASLDEYPWMVAVFPGDGLCGGSLIDSNWIITAAHCVEGMQVSDIKVLLGVHDITKGEKVGIKRYIVHPNYYSQLSFDFDIALIELKEHTHFQPISLISHDDKLDGKEATSIGWGRTSLIHPYISKKLQQVTMPIVSNEECRSAYGESIVTENMLCAGKNGGNIGTYKGDSGGPLMIKTKNKWELVGITSWGSIKADSYSVYTRVSKFKKWISLNIIDDISKDANYYMIKFYNQYKSFFGESASDIVDCDYPDWKCQSFVNGKKISVHKDTYYLEWWDGSQWYEYGIGSKIYGENKIDINPTIKSNIDKFYNKNRDYFGIKLGGIVACYEEWVCQNFTNGKRISIHTSTYALEFWDGFYWNAIW